MALDLSRLDQSLASEPTIAAGKPLELLLTDVYEDPAQPRREFSEIAMRELADSITQTGVRQPISVRPHPTETGKWMINFGARRYRASTLAGKTTIPAFVDESSTDFDQVIENEQRENLKPMELAIFIDGKIKEGVKRAEIARRLGKDAAIITQHLALIDAPDCVLDAYRTGKCNSPKTLYELRTLFEKHPEEVQAWYATAEEVTRKTVNDLAAEIKGKTNSALLPVDQVKPDTGNTGNISNGGGENLGHDQGNEKNEGDDQGNSNSGTEENQTVTTIPFHNPELEKDSVPNNADPEKLKKPLLLVKHKKREAMLLLNKRPSSAGLAWVRYEDGSGDEEVELGQLKISLLTEAQ